MTSEFNIIRELYLNKDNRNILNEFIKYLNRETRLKFMINISTNPPSLCNNCFSESQIIYKIKCKLSSGYSFCAECTREHFDKYSKYLYCDYMNNSNLINIRFLHKCDIFNNDSGRVMIKSDVNHFLKIFTNVEKMKSSPSDIFINKNF